MKEQKVVPSKIWPGLFFGLIFSSIIVLVVGIIYEVVLMIRMLLR